MRSADGERDEEFHWPVRRIVGLVLLAGAALSASIVAASPAPYGIEAPGPVFDVLGETPVGGEQVPLIDITGAPTHVTDGVLDMLTVTANSPQHLPSWLEVVQAYFDPKKAVLPIEALYPPTPEGVSDGELEAALMNDSQQAAIAAALTRLGYEGDPVLRVVQVLPGSPADGVLEVGDLLESVNGLGPDSSTEFRAEVAANGTERPVRLVVSRAGQRLALDVVPELSAETPPAPILGITITTGYHWPIEVRIQLENVGGPSAGMMFALGIIDKLGPESLTGGKTIAGTGTIDAAGTVGPIGGIRQKLYAARDNGAEWFLAPVRNCDEVVGSVPSGIRAVAVGTLDDALAALRTIAGGGDTSALRTCEAVVAGR